ncbi:DNA (cytosine-5-)-methyltransferase [Enterococcus faecium]|uniref:DNA cytosine methyltransferase n=1 Tax=Enterococcus TaxID=1350 RepID=UPI00100FCE3E|nr:MULTISPECIES: DNA (cytosine-5-)-methyltransferase [Enterococcus]MBC9710306.1 DNA (cytosine-5-)-methyltransferase [Enterococcus sp.]NWJ14620.1 DNA (cytosine-5-)-methyltransferase [Clostridium perfringens]EGP4877017.1 DNA (cytosine-5-)-methyltransferase [Enterococcus faecium]EME7197459.1 DNA (cytosine-5-)-methyltransferase [Enterococcus faecium]EMF0269829.1 DNA (cytosine-5-)-methyltransferase [Enterococcus hirae]
MNYVDLFSGAGGLSLGFEMAGFNNVFSVEYDKKIAESYKKNFPTHNLLVKDIQEITDDEIITLQHNQEVDVVIGGPPCQGFSLAGRIGRSFVEDKRNYLFKEFVRVVKIIDPPMFVMENVARILSHNKGETIKELTNEFKKIGYNVQYKVLQAADYGVPQKRQRIFIVGTKNKEFNFPTPIGTTITVKEAIGDLPPLKSGERSEVPNHFSMNHSSQMLKKMSYIGDGGNRNQIPEDLRPKTGDIRKYIRYDSQKPSVTVTGDMRKIFHYEQNRALTPRELARLQSFPDSFIFEGNSISIQQQIGNAVPPLLGYAVAKQVKESLERK